jgi:hypothetical protein
MANANAPLEFTGDQGDMVRRLALVMKVVAAVLLGLAVVNVIGGVMTLLSVSATGLSAIIEGLVTGLLGLIMLSSSADVRFMAETKFTPIHLGNAFQNLTAFYKGQFFLALFLAAVAVIQLAIG